jgi:integrase
MRKKLSHTKCTVRLRKCEFRDAWHLFIEAYPVYKTGSTTPVRVKEALNRTVTTPIWDKRSPSRRLVDGSISYSKVKRDENGIIQCKSLLDKESCVYAEKVRELLQHEYDNEELYSEQDAEMKAFQEKNRSSVIEYIRRVKGGHGNKVEQNKAKRVIDMLTAFNQGDDLPFSKISVTLIENFRNYVLTCPKAIGSETPMAQNTASIYYALFISALKNAYAEGYLSEDCTLRAKRISMVQSHREYLTTEELNLLAKTHCASPVVKRAALFSALTGLRISDIRKLKWSEVVSTEEGYRLNFTQQKTKRVEYMPISEQAYQLCGERKADNQLVFSPLQKLINKVFVPWVKAAGITRKITFHSLRHTYATLQLAGGTDIYTVSKMLGHTKIMTTQIYAKIVDSKKTATTNVIKIDTEIEGISEINSSESSKPSE